MEIFEEHMAKSRKEAPAGEQADGTSGEPATGAARRHRLPPMVERQLAARALVEQAVAELEAMGCTPREIIDILDGRAAAVRAKAER